MNWLKGNNPVRELRKHEPGVTSLALENHWKQARDVMLKSKDPESAITVISHFNQMISFLRLSREDSSSWSTCKDFWIKNRCSDKAIKWLHELGAQRCDKDDLKLVHTLQSLLELASEDGQLLGYVLTEDVNESDTWDGACSLSTLLLELCISVDPKISEAARKSFVLLIHLASKYPELENRISQEARLGVTNMTISGLSACFAQLPTFSPASNEQLQPFIEQLHFVDCVVLAATDTLSSTIADCFSKNFLYAVILPALTQDDGSRSLHTQDDQNYLRSVHEEIAVVTSYLQIVCENISHPLLIKSLIRFVMTQLLTTLLHRMNHPSTVVTVATLSLLNVLLEFYCEDLWYEAILRHLMPQNHLMVSQRNHRLPDVDFQEAALRFISLLPTSVTDVLGPETISQNFMQYVNSEVSRWSSIDGISYPDSIQVPNVSLEVSIQSNMCSLDESTKKCSSNPVFLLWKFKYDGADKLEGTSVPSSLVNLRSSNGKTDASSISQAVSPESRSESPPIGSALAPDVGINAQEVDDRDPPPDPLSVSSRTVEDKFTTISLQPNNEEMNSIGIGMSETSFDSELVGGLALGKRFDSVNDQSDGYSSMESGVMDNVASFGPFVDCLFNHLTNFTKLDPDIILMVTELVSTLASCRLPLISSLFLDQNLTLQPSFRSFLLILNRIRLELDKSMSNQHQIVSEVWGQMARDISRLEESHSTNYHLNQSVSETNSLHSSFSETLTDNIRKTINSKNLVAAMSAVFQRKSVPVSANESSQEAIQSMGNQGYRYQSGRPGTATATVPNQEIHRIMATRAIFFTHWLLELSAIATQHCWKRFTD